MIGLNRSVPAVSAVALAIAALTAAGPAPSAQASCLSALGFSTGPECSSTFASVAIALGTAAEAHADGLLGAALAVGEQASATTGNVFTVATAIGRNGIAVSRGLFGVAAQLGPNGRTATSGSGPTGAGAGFNLAVNLSTTTTVPDGTYVKASGVGNVAVNLFGGSSEAFGQGGTGVFAMGTANLGVNLGGRETIVNGGVGSGTANIAFQISGGGNAVTAGPGPLAIAGSIAQNGVTVRRLDPGININQDSRAAISAVNATNRSRPAAATRAARTDSNRTVITKRQPRPAEIGNQLPSGEAAENR